MNAQIVESKCFDSSIKQDFVTASKAVVNWCGRKFSIVNDCFMELGTGFAKGVQKIIRVAGKLTMDPTSLARLCRLGITAFAVVEKCVGRPGIFTCANSQMAAAESMIYTVSVGDQVKYFATGEQKKESVLASLGQGALLVAGIGGVFVLLGEVALLNFSKISQAMGSIPLLSEITKIGFNFSHVVAGVAALGFGIFVIDTAIKLSEAKTTQEKVQKTIDLAWMISETALATLCFITAFLPSSPVTIAGFVVLGAIAAGIGIISFVYSMHVDDIKNEAKEQLNLSKNDV